MQPQPIDQHLIDALTHGLPNCAGVALGIDRLIMLAINKQHINQVISFDGPSHGDSTKKKTSFFEMADLVLKRLAQITN